jgi:hypothetical protein
MKTALVIILPFFALLNAEAQTSTWGNPDYTSFYSKCLRRIDTVQLNKGDMEIRLWFYSGTLEKYISSLVSLTKNNDKWNADYYTFETFRKPKDSIVVVKKSAILLDYASLYQQLLKDSIMYLNSDGMDKLLDSRGQHSWMWTDFGPTNYTVQVVTNKKTITATFKCPKYFYYEAKIEEFKIPLKVISSILKLIGVNDPC